MTLEDRIEGLNATNARKPDTTVETAKKKQNVYCAVMKDTKAGKPMPRAQCCAREEAQATC